MLKLRNSTKERVFEVREEKENLIFEPVDVAQEERGMIEKIGRLRNLTVVPLTLEGFEDCVTYQNEL